MWAGSWAPWALNTIWTRGSDHQGYHYVLGRPNGDVKALAEKLNAALDGRGGGRGLWR